MADALVRHLNTLGFQPIFLPDPGVTPPELYEMAQSQLVRLGALSHFLQKKGWRQHIQEGPMPDIEVVRTTAKGIKGTVSFLKKALQALGLSAEPKLDGAINTKGKLVFRVEDVTYQRVDLGDIGEALQSLSVKKLYGDDVEGRRLHIAYEYLYASKLVMHSTDAHGFAAEAGAGALADLAKIMAKATIKAENASTISFTKKEKKPVAFAYRAAQLRRSAKGKWELMPVVSLGGGFMGIPDDEQEFVPFVPAKGKVLDVEPHHSPSE